jgi:hypothetical protein
LALLCAATLGLGASGACGARTLLDSGAPGDDAQSSVGSSAIGGGPGSGGTDVGVSGNTSVNPGVGGNGWAGMSAGGVSAAGSSPIAAAGSGASAEAGAGGSGGGGVSSGGAGSAGVSSGGAAGSGGVGGCDAICQGAKGRACRLEQLKVARLRAARLAALAAKGAYVCQSASDCTVVFYADRCSPTCTERALPVEVAAQYSPRAVASAETACSACPPLDPELVCSGSATALCTDGRCEIAPTVDGRVAADAGASGASP